ncbi:hypothetical protein O3M35_006707 [Rhynocoris fuscipes]|uniref:Uncharacterized protein n=1 Tax=Rhynocoris fuscipes TaxID=488301 RepID=A0AAW1DEC5_9HEMI
MSEERLSDFISIEQEQARKLELDELINDFAKNNVRHQSRFLTPCSKPVPDHLILFGQQLQIVDNPVYLQKRNLSSLKSEDLLPGSPEIKRNRQHQAVR